MHSLVYLNIEWKREKQGLALLIVGIHGYNYTGAGELAEWQVLWLLPALLAPAGQETHWFGDPLRLYKPMCFTLFAVDFIMFATLLWAHSTKPSVWGRLTAGVTAQGGQSVPQGVAGSTGGKHPTKLTREILLLH